MPLQPVQVFSAGQPLQVVEVANTLDEKGYMTGGSCRARGLAISWQDGPIGWPIDPTKINGTFPTVVIQAVIERLKAYQQTQLSTHETDLAILHLGLAQDWLDKRVKEREVQGSYGK